MDRVIHTVDNGGDIWKYCYIGTEEQYCVIVSGHVIGYSSSFHYGSYFGGFIHIEEILLE